MCDYTGSHHTFPVRHTESVPRTSPEISPHCGQELWGLNSLLVLRPRPGEPAPPRAQRHPVYSARLAAVGFLLILELDNVLFDKRGPTFGQAHCTRQFLN